MPSTGTRWKAAFVTFVVLVAAWMVWQTKAKLDSQAGEDVAQQELTSLAEKNRAACERDPVEAARVLGPGVCQTAKEITERPPAEKGDPGEPGARGPAGPQGEEGPRGPAGPAGPQGATGPRGPAGVDGSSPACLLTANACTGATGPRGPAGETGETGARGEQGEQGPTGEKGAQGDQGEKGDTGERGAQGEAGVNGRGIQSVECDAPNPITFRWTWTDGTVGTATCGGGPPTTPPAEGKKR